MNNDMSMMTSMAISKATQTNLGVSQDRAKSLSHEQDAAKKEAELRKASEGFEAIFIQNMWEEMRSSMPKNGMHGSKEEEYWQSMYSQQLGENVAANGGIGLADMMMEQLSRERVKSPSAQNVLNRLPMEVPPAPLLENQPKPEVKQAVSNISQSPQAPVKTVDDFYQSMDVAEADNVKTRDVINTGTKNIELKTAPILDLNVEASGDFGHSYYAEPFEEANSQANVKLEAKNVPQLSPILRQTLDELQTLANPAKAAEPTIIRTRYVSNLPASERKNAILDRNGKISAKHLASLQPKEELQVAQPMRLGNRERSMQAPLNEKITTQEIDSYPENLIPSQAGQLGNNLNNVQENAKLKKAEQILNADVDILAGVQTRYVAPVAPKGIPVSLSMEKIMSHMARSSSFFPSDAEVQAELNTILGKNSNRDVYGTILANSTQINSPNLYSPMMKTENIAYANIPSNTNMTKSLNNDMHVPVFHTMPSLDEALQSGTLIASLSPEQIRATQLGQKSAVKREPMFVEALEEIKALEKTNKIEKAENILSNATGGPQLFQPPQALPSHKVSGISPQLSMLDPLQEGEIRSNFGWRLDPFSKQRAWHTGLDIQAEAGSKVKVAHDGVVSFAGKDAEFGNMIIVEHGNGMQSIYGHNAELLVKEGEKISAGTNIANVGMSGRAVGAHLHFEVRHNGLPINPEPYLSKNKA